MLALTFFFFYYYGVTKNSGHSKLLEDFQKQFAVYANTWDQKSYIQLGFIVKSCLCI